MGDVFSEVFVAGYLLRGGLEVAPFTILIMANPVPPPLAATVAGLRFITVVAAGPFFSAGLSADSVAWWFLQLIVGPVLSAMWQLTPVAPLSSVTVTIAGILHLAGSIDSYLKGGGDDRSLYLAESIIGAVSTQVLRIGVWPGIAAIPGWGQAYMVVLIVLGVLNAVSSETVAVLHAARAADV